MSREILGLWKHMSRGDLGDVELHVQGNLGAVCGTTCPGKSWGCRTTCPGEISGLWNYMSREILGL